MSFCIAEVIKSEVQIRVEAADAIKIELILRNSEGLGPCKGLALVGTTQNVVSHTICLIPLIR